MNLIIDIGNTVAKLAVFDGDELIEVLRGSNHSLDCMRILCNKYKIDRCIIASVITLSNTIKRQLAAVTFPVLELNYKTPVPVTNNYKTPETLGMDRLAAVVGANYIKPQRNLLVIDAGTALTFEFIDEKAQYWGGNISPGIYTRFKALSACCDKLPLIEKNGETPEFGFNTETAIRTGVIKGIEFEIAGYISQMQKKYPDLLVFLTGGDKFSFDTNLKSIIFADRFLVLKGLNRILDYNVK
ncbi:MAG: type III pantothenate kinase [Phocaeicola sp.]|nr:type III pantothenate kinase [Phocaeicola sp.]